MWLTLLFRRRKLVGSQIRHKKSISLRVELLETRDCPSGSYLLVAEYDNHQVLRYDTATGAFVDQFVPRRSGGLKEPQFLVFGPKDHHLYVGMGHFGGPLKAVLRYDGTSGEFMDEFTESDTLNSVHGVIFGPDGNLYVGDAVSTGFGQPIGGRILRFDGGTGAFQDEFVPLGTGGMTHPFGMIFAPDRRGKLDLYVCDFQGGNGGILRYDGTTGAFLGTFVPAGSGRLGFAVGLSLGPDGNFYVTSLDIKGGLAAVLRFQGPTGRAPAAFVDVFVPPGSGGLLNPQAAIFGPDGNGDGHQDLYVSNSEYTGQGADKGHFGNVKRYDGVTGAFLDTFIAIGSGGLNNPTGLTFTETDPMTLAYAGPPSRGMLPSAECSPARIVTVSFGNLAKAESKTGPTPLFIFTVTLSNPFDQPVTMSFATADGTTTTGSGDSIAKTGTLTFAPGETTKTITIEVKADSKKEGDETFYLDLFGNSSNAQFTKLRGIGMILNDD